MGVCRGVLQGLEALEGTWIGNKEFGVVARGEVREGAEEGFGDGGRDVMTRGSFGGLWIEEESFEVGGASPFTAEGAEVVV